MVDIVLKFLVFSHSLTALPSIRPVQRQRKVDGDNLICRVMSEHLCVAQVGILKCPTYATHRRIICWPLPAFYTLLRRTWSQIINCVLRCWWMNEAPIIFVVKNSRFPERVVGPKSSAKKGCLQFILHRFRLRKEWGKLTFWKPQQVYCEVGRVLTKWVNWFNHAFPSRVAQRTFE